MENMSEFHPKPLVSGASTPAPISAGSARIPVSAKRAEQETFIHGDFEYTLLDDGTAKIVRYTGNAETLQVPGELDGHTTSAVGDRAFWCSSLTSVTLPDSVTSIGDEAFSRSGLTSIALPDSVTAVGANPFANCTSLTTIVVSIDNPALASIGGVLFSKADRRLICYPRGFKQPDYSVPQGIKVIGDEAFENCSLASITLPDSVTSIGRFAFRGCYKLTSITLPKGLISIGVNPFVGDSKDLTIVVSLDNPAFTVKDGVLFSKSDKRLICYSHSFNKSHYSVPQGTKVIDDYAFFDCSSLTSIALRDGVTAIGNGAFYSCKSLTTVTLPDSVTAIGYTAFCYCESLTSISLPASVTSIGDGTFWGCHSLTTITLPDSVTSIGDNAFKDCSSLTSFVVGRNSYAKQYCIDHGLPFTYPDLYDWLND